MNILLTGSSGFLGSYVLDEIKKNNLVYTLNRNFGDYLCDLSQEIPKFESSFDCVIHAAGLAHFSLKNANESLLFDKINVNGTKNLLLGLDRIKIPKEFVFISSVSVYGLRSGIGINEDQELLARDPYGKSKVESENIIFKWCSDRSIKCTILRLPLVFGKKSIGNLGSMIKAIEKGFYFNIGGGHNRRSIVLASDVAKYLLVASEIGGIYNLTDGNNPSFFELSNKISDFYKRKKIYSIPFLFASFIAFFGDFFGDAFPLNSVKLKKMISSLTFDDSKAIKAFNWSPKSVLNYFDSQCEL